MGCKKVFFTSIVDKEPKKKTPQPYWLWGFVIEKVISLSSIESVKYR